MVSSISSPNHQVHYPHLLTMTLLFFSTPFIIVMIYLYNYLLTRRRSELFSREIINVVLLGAVSIFSYFVCYAGTYDILWSVQRNSFGPSEAVAIISAVGGATVAISTGIAAIIKACALFLHGRADVIRARGEAQNATVARDVISSGKLELKAKPPTQRSGPSDP